MLKKTISSAVFISLVSVGYAGAQAATQTSTMVNTVTITNSCTIVATGFTTTYDAVVANATTNQDVTGSVTTNCTIGTSPVVTLGQGANSNAGSTDAVPLRRLASGGGTPAYLNYSLFSDTGRSVTWGNTPATAPTPVVATIAPTVSIIYARIPFGQTTSKAAVYTDSVIATVTF